MALQHIGTFASLRRAHALAITFALASFAVVHANEADFSTVHSRAIAANPAGVRFSIALASRQTQFRVGELIPLEMTYQFDRKGPFQINDGLAQDSGTARLLEVFRVTPDANTRSMAANEPNFHSWAGGTPLNVQPDRAYAYHVYLNEWRRFDAPGRYRFYSQSARVWKAKVEPDKDNDLRLTSNLLEIEIVAPTDAWQDEQVRKSLQVLDHSKASENDSALTKQRLEALRRLRYLDTEAATRQLARQITSAEDLENYECGMGLYESKYKRAAVEELERLLNAPDFVVTNDFLRQLAGLAADASIPVDYSRFKSPESQVELNRLQENHDKLERDLFTKYSELCWTAIEQKSPLIRAKSLLERLPGAFPDPEQPSQPLSPERLSRIHDAVLHEFAHLTPNEQWRVLRRDWKQLGGMDFLPVLRRFIVNAPERQVNDARPSVLDHAFHRVCELTPDEGNSLILQELRRRKPRATIETFRRLPAVPIVELDDSLASRLENSIGDLNDGILAATLAARFGTVAIYGRVRAVYGDNGGYWACSTQAALLAYLIRNDAREGIALLNQALDATGPDHTHCFATVLGDVASVHMSPEIERIAIQRLNDKNAEIAASAISVLGNHGSAAAEPELWRRMEKWHSDWKGRTDELAKSSNDPDVRHEGNLIYALSNAKSWTTGQDRLQRLRDLCLTKSNQSFVDRMLDSWKEPLAIHFSPGHISEFSNPVRNGGMGGYRTPSDTWSVAQYHAQSLDELKRLLIRFPAKSSFRFPTGMLTDQNDERKLFKELQDSLILRNQKLVEGPARE